MEKRPPQRTHPLSSLMFASRWLQLPLYLGLIVVRAVYVWQFMRELWHLLTTWADSTLTEVETMLIVLGLIDVVLISDLLIMVIIGGYEKQMPWQMLIHLTFLVSALAIAGVERILPPIDRDGKPSH